MNGDDIRLLEQRVPRDQRGADFSRALGREDFGSRQALDDGVGVREMVVKYGGGRLLDTTDQSASERATFW